jgi:hypothetical protein
MWRSGNSHYLVPECDDNLITSESDVFSFVLILHELMVGKPAIPKAIDSYKVGVMTVISCVVLPIPKIAINRLSSPMWFCQEHQLISMIT